MPVRRTLGAVCGIAAPTAFVSAWLVGGLQSQDYQPLRDAISELAREGAETRPLMTGGFVAFGALLPVWAPVLGRRLGSAGVRNAAVVAGLSTLGVALLPLTRDGDTTQDTLHAVAAGTGYLAMAVTPLLAAAPLRRLGHERAAATSVVVGAVSAAALVGTLLFDERGGGLQRLGLGVVDLWHVAAAAWVLRAR
jgi:hypothetical membrane protein